MDSTAKSHYGCLTLSAAGAAILLTCLAAIGRPDSARDAALATVFHVFVLGPSWGAFVFLRARSELGGKGKGLIISLAFGAVAWVVAVIVGGALERMKYP